MVNIVVLEDDGTLTSPATAVRELPLTAFGELLVAEKTFGAGWNFYTDLNPASVEETNVGSGGVTQADAMASLSSGTTTASSSLLKTKRSVDYLNGTGVQVTATAVFAVGSTGTLAEIGLGDADNGWFFQELEGVFGVVRRQDGTDTFVAQASWNVDEMDGNGPSGQLLDITKGNVYKIEFQWLGFGVQNFYIEDSETGAFQLVHRIKYANTATVPSVYVPNLPIRAYVENTTSTTDVILKTPSSAAYTQGKPSGEGERFATFVNASFAAGEKNAIQIRNKTTFSGATNYARLEVDIASIALDSGKPATFLVHKNASMAGAVWNDIDTTNSRVEVNEVQGLRTGGRLLLPLALAQAGADNAIRVSLFVEPGETISITVNTSQTSDCIVGLSWQEIV